MNSQNDIKEFYFSWKPVSLIITASSHSIKSMNFTHNVLNNKNDLPDNVRRLFEWLHNYSLRKFSYLFNIILLDQSGERNSGIKKDSILLDTSCFTDKERRVYRELINVRPGQVTSYGELAERCGIPHGGRFIGNAMAKNRFPVIIPCHRVIKGDGTPGNFSGGVGIKEALLMHEGRV